MSWPASTVACLSVSMLKLNQTQRERKIIFLGFMVWESRMLEGKKKTIWLVEWEKLAVLNPGVEKYINKNVITYSGDKSYLNCVKSASSKVN